jgi:hypothetical protein
MLPDCAHPVVLDRKSHLNGSLHFRGLKRMLPISMHGPNYETFDTALPEHTAITQRSGRAMSAGSFLNPNLKDKYVDRI